MVLHRTRSQYVIYSSGVALPGSPQGNPDYAAYPPDMAVHQLGQQVSQAMNQQAAAVGAQTLQIYEQMAQLYQQGRLRRPPKKLRMTSYCPSCANSVQISKCCWTNYLLKERVPMRMNMDFAKPLWKR
jgi:hypothetical protein